MEGLGLGLLRLAFSIIFGLSLLWVVNTIIKRGNARGNVKTNKTRNIDILKEVLDVAIKKVVVLTKENRKLKKENAQYKIVISRGL